MANQCPPSTIYVDASVSASGNGTTWATAFKTLPEALAVAHCCPVVDTIKVAAGTYKPTQKPFSACFTQMTTTEARDITFHLPDGIVLLGGYPAGGGARNVAANTTTLSGDINGDDVVTGSGSSLSITGNTENVFHVVLAVAPTTGGIGVTVDGFTITGGNADVSRTVIVKGKSTGSSSGGGIFTVDGTNTLNNNTLSGNSADYGGGIYTSGGANTLNNNTLSGNSANFNCGGIYTVDGNNTLNNNTLSGNSANFNCGGIYTFGGANTLSNNTLSGNSANSNGGGIVTQGGNNTLANNIFWGNTKGGSATVQGADYRAFSSANTFVHNLLQLAISNYTTTGSGNYDLGTAAPGNLFAQDPLFVDAGNPAGPDGIHRTADDGLRLQASSPAINTGIATYGSPNIVPATDILGATRPQGSGVDMGAYEYVQAVADCNGTPGGTAYLDDCDICVGGNTGLEACVEDCNGAPGGSALPGTACDDGNPDTIDDVFGSDCICSGTLPLDCEGTPGGTAYKDDCGICVGGNTGNTPCVEDCTGVPGGSAQIGTPCDDGDPNTIDDAFNANCECVGTPAPPACNTYYASDAANLNLAIPDNNATGISSTINVPATGTITELVCVTVNITHTWVGDLAIKLAHNGAEVQLIRRTGTGGAGYSSNLDGNYTFCATGSDFAAAAAATTGNDIIPTSPPNYARSNNSSSSQLIPPAISGIYANFVGLDVNGDWTLTISDHAAQDIGTLHNWSFEVCTGGAAVPDCNGTPGGTASVDACGVCSGGTTGITPNACNDCNGTPNGTASIDACGVCSGGTTGITPNACNDCNGTPNGTASIDACGVCSGGTTGLTPNATCADCAGVPNGTASIDNCGNCTGGNTGLIPNATCADCAGVPNGTASIDNCGNCTGGNTGLIPNATCADCAGVPNGTASIDNCGNCTGGNTGIEPNTPITNTTTITACGSYTWSVTGLTYTQPGAYTVTVSDCLIEQLVLTIPPEQVVSLTGNTTVCAGSVIGLTATGGNQYQWSGPNGYSATGGGSITRTNATTAMSGTYTVTITNNECVTILSTTVTVYPIPAATITGASPVCSGGAISLSAPAGAESYAWSGPGGFTASGATINRPNATTAMAGTYTVTVTGAGGCTATASRSVSVSTPTTATITGATGFCSNGAVTLTATTAGVSYQWSGPGGFSFSGATMTRTPAVAGTYTVTVSNASGCISTASRTVSVTAAPNVNIANYTNCTRIYLIASGGNSYAWSGPNGFTLTGTTVNRNNPTATMWGTYTVTVTSGGCTATASVTVSPCGSGKNAGEELTQNMSVYPNPTGNISNISFYTYKEEAVTLSVFAADGKEIAVLFNQTAQPDTAYSVVFDATQLPNGAYYAVLRHADGTQETLPVLVTK